MNQLKWEKTDNGTIRLLSVEGTPGEVIVPEEIEGLQVTEVGPYCFAKNKILERVILPDSVTTIDRMAFYNCTSLRELELGQNLISLGSDAFMNCHRLHLLKVRCGATERSGVRLILRQISHELSVHFLGTSEADRCEEEAKLLFMDYYESYDEVAPAHLFGRNIEGEGFRARQFFKDGMFEYEKYDFTFQKACAEEREETLCEMALHRLRYPVRLTSEAKVGYEAYVKKHLKMIHTIAIRERDLACMAFLCENRLMNEIALEEAARLAAESEWAEGGAYILRLKAQYFMKKSRENRYEF